MSVSGMRRSALWRAVAAVALLLRVPCAFGDGIVVDRIYDPYVQPLETEIELRSVIQYDDDAPDLQKHFLGVGHSLSDRWFAELYAVWSEARDDVLALDQYELEFKWQLTEQGEYAIDWGMVFELERKVDTDVSEFSTIIVSARDFGRWTAVANLALVFESGSGVSDEFETRFHLQTRYRYREALEPAIELHIGQDTSVLGPAMTGVYRVAPGKKLDWEAGIFWALDDESPDRVVKINLEYEF
jgi:hypothetical protein